MTKPALNKALVVGVLVAIAGATFLITFTFIRKGGLSEKDSYVVFAYFNDATGLTWKSKVDIAGIQVGEISQVTLVGNRARLDLRVKKEIDVRADACLSKRFPSTLLPDAVLEVAPGTTATPSLSSLPESQREVRCVREAVTVTQLIESMSKITADVERISADVAQTIGGTSGSVRQIIENLSKISTSLEQTVSENGATFSQILKNTNAFTAELSQIAEEDRGRFRAITRNVEESTALLKRVLAGIDELLGTGGGAPIRRQHLEVPPSGPTVTPIALQEAAPQEPGLQEPEVRERVAGVKQTIEKLNATLDQVEKVTKNIAEGKGVAGKVLADERLGEQLGKSIEGVSNYVDKLIALQIQPEIRSEWLLNQSGAKVYFELKLVPRPDKYFLVAVVSDPRGVPTSTTTVYQTATTQSTITSTVYDTNKLAFSAEFAKRYGPITFRIGIIENSGGVGGDLHLLDDRLQVSVDVFQFFRPATYPTNYLPRAKLFANYYFLNHLYATIGQDDFLNAWRAQRFPGGSKFAFGNDVFIGAGLYFTDDDIKTILGGLSGGVSAVR